MNRSSEQAHLFLNNDFCISGANRSDSTYGVNFKELLGNMYNKYDKFLIVLNSHQAYTTTWTIAADNSNICNLRLIGLNWCHSSYGTVTTVLDTGTNKVNMFGNNSEAIVPMSIFTIPTSGNGPTSQTYPGNISGLVFHKPREEITQLRIFMRDFRGNNIGSTAPATHYMMITYSFTIYGLYD